MWRYVGHAIGTVWTWCNGNTQWAVAVLLLLWSAVRASISCGRRLISCSWCRRESKCVCLWQRPQRKRGVPRGEREMTEEEEMWEALNQARKALSEAVEAVARVAAVLRGLTEPRRA